MPAGDRPNASGTHPPWRSGHSFVRRTHLRPTVARQTLTRRQRHEARGPPCGPVGIRAPGDRPAHALDFTATQGHDRAYQTAAPPAVEWLPLSGNQLKIEAVWHPTGIGERPPRLPARRLHEPYHDSLELACLACAGLCSYTS